MQEKETTTRFTVETFRKFGVQKKRVSVCLEECQEQGKDTSRWLTVVVFPFNYEKLVSAILNELYPADKVQALTANFLDATDEASETEQSKTLEYMSEYYAYQRWRRWAKRTARCIIESEEEA